MDTSDHRGRPTPVREDHTGRFAAFGLAILVAAVLGGIGGAAAEGAFGSEPAARAATPLSSAAPARASAAAAPAGGTETPEQIYQQDAPGVVVITDVQTQQSGLVPFGSSQVGVLGSGFVIDRKGDIVTNDHVVKGASHVRVGFSNGASFPATVVGADASTDLAVVHVSVSSSALHPLALDNSGAVEVGDPAYALGNPFGLDRTLTAGIVSAVGRSIQAPNGLTIPDAIQTDAAINHGNSGGPLLDRRGRVIGVNDQIESGGVNGNVGVGFAVPSDTVHAVVPQLLANGKAMHAWLGVRIETIDPAIAAAVKGLPEHGSLVVGVVSGGPAAKAGLVAGHRHVTVNGVGAVVGGAVFVAVDGKAVQSDSGLADAIAAHQPGQIVTLGVVRNGRSRTVSVTLGNAPANLPSTG